MAITLSSLPPVAALFLTHFDDIKGQNTVYFRSAIEGVVSDNIEHSSLPSGLHTTQQDLVLFRHGGLPAVGLFRSRDTSTSAPSASTTTGGAMAGSSAPRGRGRRMATLGVILGPGASPDKLFDLQPALGDIYDRLESTGDFLSDASSVLDGVWGELSLSSGTGEGIDEGEGEVARNAVALLLSRNRLESGSGSVVQGKRHPIEYMSTLVAALGPSVVLVYKAALAGKRILLFSTPPLLPLSALAWCIWSTSLPPPQSDAAASTWLGHVGLMDLSALSTRPGGWVATTSDAIFRSHPKAWDVFIDLSPLTLKPPPHLPSTGGGGGDIEADTDADDLPSGDPIILSSSAALVPSKEGSVEVTYAFADLPLYKSLLDPPGTGPTSAASPRRTRRGWWLVFYDVVTGVFEVCRGVCEYALALNLVRGNGGAEGGVKLDEGEEDARELDFGLDEDAPLLPRASVGGGEAEVTAPGDDSDGADGAMEEDGGEEEESVLVGRQILRILGHNTHHLYEQMRIMGAKSPGRRLGEDEIRLLAGRWARAEERSWWWSLAKTWGL